MIYYEKINVPIVELVSKPGIIDTFFSAFNPNFDLSFLYKNCFIYKTELLEQTKNHIRFAEKFGSEGANLLELFAEPGLFNDTIFEIGCPDIIRLPSKHLKFLLENFNVLVYELANGGSGTFQYHFLKLLDSLTIEPKNLHIVLSNYNLTSSEDLKIKLKNVHVLPCISIFALYTASSNLKLVDNTEWYEEKIINKGSKFKYHAKIYNHKPRRSRLEVLYKLHTSGILDNCLWSLAWCADDVIELSNNNESLYGWNASPIVKELSDNANQHPFILERKHQLPKNIEPYNHLQDLMFLDFNWVNDVKWGISIETGIDAEKTTYLSKHGFLTEKTFRYLLLGIPVLPVSNDGATRELERLGFQTIIKQSDIESVCNFCIEDFHDKKMSAEELNSISTHNFKTITNKSKLVSHLVNSLLAIKI